MKLWHKYIARKFLLTLALLISSIVLLCYRLITGLQFVSLVSLITAFYHGHDAYTTQMTQTQYGPDNADIEIHQPDIANMIVKGSPRQV